LSFKLLNLAAVLSLTNLLLNILKHRNLPFLLGEHVENVKDTDGPESNETERDEKIAKQKMVMTKRIDNWIPGWRWWHFTKVYTAFIIWFLLPITIIISSFYFYPMTTISIPSVTMILGLLILLAVNSGETCWRKLYKSIGTLL